MPLQQFAPSTTAIPTGIHEGILFGILLVAGANSCNGQLADWKYYCRISFVWGGCNTPQTKEIYRWMALRKERSRTVLTTSEWRR